MKETLQALIGFQREFYLAFANQITVFANGGDWGAFLAYLPMGILFGAAHDLTPGQSGAILATYLTGTPFGLIRGLGVSLALSFTHVTMSVPIALLSLPFISITLGSVGRADVGRRQPRPSQSATKARPSSAENMLVCSACLRRGMLLA